MNLGKVIKDRRKMIGFSQAKLADVCGITQPYLSLIEKNKKEPNMATLKILSTQLDMPLPVLFIRAMDISDVPVSKREGFKIISESLDKIVDSLFMKNDSDSEPSL